MNIVGKLGIVLIVAFAAGCLNGNADPDSNSPPTETNSPTATATSTGPGENRTMPDEPDVPIHEILLTNCQTTKAFRNYPAGLAPGERPDGWGPDSPDNISSVSLHVYKCERIAIAGYERGPIHLLLDYHGNAAIPPDCQAADPDAKLRILQHLLLDDPEIGAYLQSTYGIPVLVADIMVSDRDAGAGTFHDWSWSIDGGPLSVVTSFEPAAIDPYPTLRDRFFWQVGTGLGVLHIEADGIGPSAELPANGTIQPPLLLASDTGGHFLGQAIWLENLAAQGTFARYSDLACKEPLP